MLPSDAVLVPGRLCANRQRLLLLLLNSCYKTRPVVVPPIFRHKPGDELYPSSQGIQRWPVTVCIPAQDAETHREESTAT
jgi:hypothetical protein